MIEYEKVDSPPPRGHFTGEIRKLVDSDPGQWFRFGPFPRKKGEIMRNNLSSGGSYEVRTRKTEGDDVVHVYVRTSEGHISVV